MDASSAIGRARAKRRAGVRARGAYLAVCVAAAAVAAHGFPPWAAKWLLVDRVSAAVVLTGGLVAGALFAALAVVIAWERRADPFALFVSATLLLRGISFIGGLPELVGADAWGLAAALVRLTYAALVVILLFVFPDGRFVPRWSAAVCAGWIAWLALTAGAPSLNPVFAADAPWQPLVVAAIAASGLVAQLYRYSVTASPRERLQTKWVTFGLAVYVTEFASVATLEALVPSFHAALLTDAPIAAAAFVLEAAAASCLAVTLAIAILRERLFDIDLIVSRTIVYGGATAIVAGTFAAISAAVQRTLIEITGERSDAATVVIALIVGATFAPVKASLQGAIDRRIRTRPRGAVVADTKR